MIKILAITPSDKEINNFWRCSGPLSYLAKHSTGEIDVRVYSYDRCHQGIFWCDLDQVDILFLHRPSTENDLKALQLAYLMNVPVWIDWDDWIFSIPSSNPSAVYYQSPDVQERITRMIQCADVISVSTRWLSELISGLNPNVITIPNAYRSDLFSRFRTDQYPDRNPTILWRGTNTHTDDLLSVVGELSHLPSPVSFLGNVSWEVFSKMNPGSYELKGQFDPLLYWHVIHNMKPKVWIVPLADNQFNHCKSNIAWMEAVHAGAICVAPNWPEWQKVGCIQYDPKDPKSFNDAVRMAYADIEQPELQYEEMVKEYDISVINEKRKTLVQDLLSGDHRRPGDPFKTTA